MSVWYVLYIPELNKLTVSAWKDVNRLCIGRSRKVYEMIYIGEL